MLVVLLLLPALPLLPPGILAARTTNFSRTRATLAGVLRGLYPEHQDPIPVVTSGQMDEVLYADTKACPHLHVLLEASAAMLQGEAEAVAVSAGPWHTTRYMQRERAGMPARCVCSSCVARPGSAVLDVGCRV
jgi:hypothetical protein